MEKGEYVAYLKLKLHPTLEFIPIGCVGEIHVAKDWRGIWESILRDDENIRVQASSNNKTLDLKREMCTFLRLPLQSNTHWVVYRTQVYFLTNLCAGNLRLGANKINFFWGLSRWLVEDHFPFISLHSPLCLYMPVSRFPPPAQAPIILRYSPH